jgi:hypothetical protein
VPAGVDEPPAPADAAVDGALEPDWCVELEDEDEQAVSASPASRTTAVSLGEDFKDMAVLLPTLAQMPWAVVRTPVGTGLLPNPRNSMTN